MAVLKHIASKNANYGESLDYLLFQHNEITGKPILDEQGRLQLRTEYYMDGINCDAMSFDQECEKVNTFYHKNQKFNEVKSHHYIISFDPRDVTDHGLTGEKAQALGLEYAKKNFPAHQALVVTHTDGHNESGNIHVHIVINSVRKYDVPKEDFMERDCDSKAGYKHHNTDKLLHHMQTSLMELCEREGLYQVDLLSSSVQKVTQAEYWANRRGQEKLDEINSDIQKDGLTPAKTKFQTQKQYIREAIDETLSKTRNLDEFKSHLLENYQISTTESRGRIRYQHSDQETAFTSKSLGAHYTKEYILSNFGIVPPVKTTPDYHKDPIQILYFKSELQLVVDLQKCVKAQQSQAYARKVKISNLRQMANTIIYVQEHNYDTKGNIQSDVESLNHSLKELKAEQSSLKEKLTAVNKQIHFAGQYFANKSAFIHMFNSKNKSSFRNEHAKEITAYEEARKYLKTLHPDGKIPSVKSLKEQKVKLQNEQSDLLSKIKPLEKSVAEIQTVQSNVITILSQTDRSKEMER